MTNIEAICQLEGELGAMETRTCLGETEEKTYEAVKMAIEALEKEIPKKPEPEPRANNAVFYCPRCGNIAMYGRCYNCGQAIDWPEVER